MSMQGIRFHHFNFNVLDLTKSIAFYEAALGLKQVREIKPADGSFHIVYLGDGASAFTLELTWLKDRAGAYDLGEGEYHLAFTTPNYKELHQRHEEMGVICFENPEMGIYFIEDPDGYWLEIVPEQ